MTVFDPDKCKDAKPLTEETFKRAMKIMEEQTAQGDIPRYYPPDALIVVNRDKLDEYINTFKDRMIAKQLKKEKESGNQR